MAVLVEVVVASWRPGPGVADAVDGIVDEVVRSGGDAGTARDAWLRDRTVTPCSSAISTATAYAMQSGLLSAPMLMRTDQRMGREDAETTRYTVL